MTAPFIQLPIPPVMEETYGMDLFITPWIREQFVSPILVQGDIGGGDISGAWPIGSVFLSVVGTSPATLLGFGTWAAFGAGKMLVGRDGADPDFDTAEETGGAKTHTHAGHSNHAFTQPSGHSNHVFTQPSSHAAAPTGAASAGATQRGTTSSTLTLAVHTHQTPVLTHAGGAVDAHSAHAGGAVDAHSAHDSPSHLPPYIVVYMWKRTA